MSVQIVNISDLLMGTMFKLGALLKNGREYSNCYTILLKIICLKIAWLKTHSQGRLDVEIRADTILVE